MHLASLLKEDGDWRIAVGAIVLAIGAAFIVDRLFRRRAERLAHAVSRGHVSRETARSWRAFSGGIGVFGRVGGCFPHIPRRK